MMQLRKERHLEQLFGLVQFGDVVPPHVRILGINVSAEVHIDYTIKVEQNWPCDDFSQLLQLVIAEVRNRLQEPGKSNTVHA